MNKLIKISNEHYIVVDDSSPIPNDFVYSYVTNTITRFTDPRHFSDGTYKKITHSTKPLYKNDFWAIQELKLSEVEEAIYGYSVEKMAKKDYQQYNLSPHHGDGTKQDYYNCFIRAFKAHQELVKDKLFTVEDILGFYEYFIYKSATNSIYEALKKYIETLLPKTEWDVEIDEQGKIKLIN